MRVQTRTVAQKIGRIAQRQHGVVARRQLIAVGIPSNAIAWRLRSGALVRSYPGVYRAGHAAPSLRATYMAAVLACGEGSMLAGRAAAFLFGLIRGAPPIPEVIAPTERRVPGIVVHRARASRHVHGTPLGEPTGSQADHCPVDCVSFQSIPVTSVARTLLDIASVLESDELTRACHEAGIKHGTRPSQIERVLARRSGSAGAARLRAIIRGDTDLVLSKLERRFLEILRAEGLPLPATNRRAGSHLVDCRWPEHKVTIELDSYRFHRSRHAWERDRRREREAYARGDQIRRFTWGDVFERPRLMIGELTVLFSVQG